eukprot:1218708-Rhodomonas_salina.2
MSVPHKRRPTYLPPYRATRQPDTKAGTDAWYAATRSGSGRQRAEARARTGHARTPLRVASYRPYA